VISHGTFDASKIADCLRCDFLPECHVASTEIRDRRRTLRIISGLAENANSITTLTLMIAGHRVGHYSAEGKLLTPLTKKQIKAVEKTFPRLARDSHARALLLAFSESYTCLRL